MRQSIHKCYWIIHQKTTRCGGVSGSPGAPRLKAWVILQLPWVRLRLRPFAVRLPLLSPPLSHWTLSCKIKAWKCPKIYLKKVEDTWSWRRQKQMLDQCAMDARSAGSVRSEGITFSSMLPAKRLPIYIEGKTCVSCSFTLLSQFSPCVFA